MLIETTAGDLRLALDKVKPAVQRRCTVPVLSCVLLADGGVTATDLDHEIMVKFAAKRFQGRVAIPFQSLFSLIKALPTGTDIRLQDSDRKTLSGKEGYGVFVTFTGGRYWLPSISASDFPEFPKAGTRIKCKAPDNFLAAVQACQPFISTEETRYYLNGVCFTKNPEGRDVVVATDGHRMIAHDLDHGMEGNLILPRKVLPSLLGLPVPTRIYRTETRIEFDMPGARLRTKLIDGAFPDWTRVIPTIPENAPEVGFDPRKMQAVLKRMRIGACNRSGNTVDICATASGETVVITSMAPDGEECSERLEGAIASNWSKLSKGIISFNSRYLIELCQTHAQEDEIVLTGADAGGPVRIGAENSKKLTILMPMRGGNGLGRQALMALSRASNDAGHLAQEVA
ncbi:DNA polymerase III subunit beta [Roseibium sp.]|uniref:DNA polymerase III subunit beta n=1 Tax=Roseibium sp. TaxID=1936156 RepID=UPI003B523A78